MQKQECIAKYCDLAAIPTIDNREKMVSLAEVDVRMAFYTEVLPRATDWDMFVRESVARKLKSVRLPDGLSLEVTYAYRSPTIQENKFRDQLKRFQKQSENRGDIIQSAHEMIAAPDVAGHPTGGAVDVWVVDDKGNPIDMGTEMHDLVDASRVFNRKALTDEQFNNRMILREAMEDAGFAAYDGEWLHFCYGDKEWAFLTCQSEAKYAPLDFDWKTETATYYTPPKPNRILKEVLACG